MNKKIFRSTCIVAFFVFLVSLALIMGVLYQYFGRQLNRELESEAVYLAHALENEGAAYFEGLPNMDKRITLVAGDGEVLYDTDADAASMENHLAREEIQEALASGTGSSSRYSKTLTQATTYYALRLSDGSVLRVATVYSPDSPVRHTPAPASRCSFRIDPFRGLSFACKPRDYHTDQCH